jgi:hypothetical protein
MLENKVQYMYTEVEDLLVLVKEDVLQRFFLFARNLRSTV